MLCYVATSNILPETINEGMIRMPFTPMKCVGRVSAIILTNSSVVSLAGVSLILHSTLSQKLTTSVGRLKIREKILLVSV